MVAVDLGAGELLAIAEIDEKEKSAVAAWLKTLKQQHNLGAIVTDDLATYKEIARELELGHQICQFHVRRWVGKALKALEPELPREWLHLIPKLQDLIKDLPSNGSMVLYELWKEMPGRTTGPDEQRTPLEKLRDLVLRLSQYWERYIEFYHDPGIPWTNNRTEQIIGRLKTEPNVFGVIKPRMDCRQAAWLPVNSGHETVFIPWVTVPEYLFLNFTYQVCYTDI